MKEVKSPKKPLIYYYSIILLIVLLFNLIVSPLLMKNQVTEVDYGTFMRMIEEKNIGEVEVEDDEILFTDKDKQQVYTTGAMDDPTLTQRLYDSGATFTKEIQKTMSPVLSFVLTNISTNSEPDMEKNGTFASPATAFASMVLPVPGGPTSSTPFGIDAPTAVYFCGLWR